MAQYGAAITWFNIMATIFITGLSIAMLTPLIDMISFIGANGGADQQVMTVIYDSIVYWLPITIVFSLVMYGWRKSKNQPGYE